MTRTLLKSHWMCDVLKNSEPALAKLTQTTSATEAWSITQLETGLSRDQMTKAIAAHYKLAVADLDAADPRILKLIPEKLARRHLVLPIQQDDRLLYVATSEPGNLQAEQDIAFASSRSTVFQVAAPETIHAAIDRAYSTFTGSHCFSNEAIGDLSLQRTELAKLPAAPAMAFAPLFERTDSQAINITETRNIAATAMEQRHVLIVDDDCVTRRLVWSILAKEDYRVVEASDGVEALERVSAGTPLILILLDLDMPRLGGRDVLKRLKSSAATASIPIIVLTGSPEEGDEAALMEDGADDYIRKPLEPARFIARIKGVLRRARMT